MKLAALFIIVSALAAWWFTSLYYSQTLETNDDTIHLLEKKIASLQARGCVSGSGSAKAVMGCNKITIEATSGGGSGGSGIDRQRGVVQYRFSGSQPGPFEKVGESWTIGGAARGGTVGQDGTPGPFPGVTPSGKVKEGE